ncbi:unnamed protein product, partial [Amoebophrya sp. A25]
QRNNPNAYYPKVFFRQENKRNLRDHQEDVNTRPRPPVEDEDLESLIQPDEERISVKITTTFGYTIETGRPGRWTVDVDKA